MAIERRAIEIRGTVQGVGFRPFVYRLARRLNVNGFVRNRAGCVEIEVEARHDILDRFVHELRMGVPPLGKIEHLSQRTLPRQGGDDFTIEASCSADADEVAIAPDIGTCSACLAEMFDPRNRRHRYPFINCTNCGPRLTIVEGVPYDRLRTTMARFEMCDACRTEYQDPNDRRFHAQPIACWDCGPRLALHAGDGSQRDSNAPLAEFGRAILAGQIGALKGLGGYHLVCDARRDEAVRELRRRKQRDEKPLALMVGNLDAASRLSCISADEQRLLLSPQRPIVLLRRRRSADDLLAPGIAPGNPSLGIMLPYTPIHHLLLHDLSLSEAVDVPLVMTSGNRSDEPIAHHDDDALERLRGIADIFLTNNRQIHVRCDDSVTRVVLGTPSPIRRSRGDAPSPIRLPIACPQTVLAVGGQLKGVFALGQGQQARLSHHLGDLDQLDAYRAFERDVELYMAQMSGRPAQIVHDLHPDYASTRFAHQFADNRGIPRLAVQHHQAHIASCMADNGLAEPVIGVAFDGTGLGTDGAIWGGEFFCGGYGELTRTAHLRYVRMPGGQRAIDEPWRMAEAHLADAGAPPPDPSDDVSSAERSAVRQMVRRQFNSPWTSSGGRLFDAAAALVGLQQRVTFEGQAAMELEWLATDADDNGSYSFAVNATGLVGDNPLVIDTRPLIGDIVADVQRSLPLSAIARRFHNTVIEIIADVCRRIRAATGIETVVLSGGVFQNVLLATGVPSRLAENGFRVYGHRQVPANDGGLSLGQLAIAAALEPPHDTTRPKPVSVSCKA